MTSEHSPYSLYKHLECASVEPQRSPWGLCCYVRQSTASPCAFCGETIEPTSTRVNGHGHYVAA